MRRRTQYDAAVVGAGPAGCVAAVALARRGARVLLLEANPRACDRFAGEWLHPPAVRILDELGLSPLEHVALHPTGYGFAALTDDEGEPIRLPYAEGAGLSCEHRDLVEALRRRAADHEGVEFAPDVRVRDIEGHALRCEARGDAATFEVKADRIVGADGRNSLVRQHLGVPDHGTRISHMAGVELHDVELPFEGYGHVLLGGPGPILAYRIGPTSIRMCLDVPASMRRDPASLWDGFAPVLPHSLRGALRRALEDRRVAWAANGFRARTAYGREHLALVGDAVGHFHPLTAAGITMGMLDARCLAESPDVETYRRQREHESYVPELLANALYQVFARQDRTAVAIRHAVYDRWRASEADRLRTMRILAGDALGRVHFSRAFVRMAVEALGQTTGEALGRGQWASVPRDLVSFREWTQWPLASILPGTVRRAQRPRSTPNQALSWAPPAAVTPPSTAASAAAPSGHGADPRTWLTAAAQLMDEGAEPGEPPETAAALEARSALASLDLVHGPAPESWVESLTGTLDAPDDRGTGARQGAAVLGAALRAAAPLAPTAALDAGLKRLLAFEDAHGGFGSALGTGRACRALAEVGRRCPGLRPRDVERARASAAAWLRASQADDGHWADPTAGALPATCEALEALLDSGAKPVEPVVRAAAAWLEDRLGEVAPDDCLAVARIGRALLTAGGCRWGVCESVASRLAGLPVAELTAGPHGRTAVYAVAVALSRFEQRRLQRPGVEPAARRVADSTPAPSDEGDWAYCQQALLDVSRTFARPIEMLPGDLCVAVTCGYLLCRVVDTVEDHPSLPIAERSTLYGLFVDALEERRPPEEFAARYRRVEGEGADHDLCRHLPRVMRIFRALPEPLQQATVPWVCEMARGMELYSHRTAGDDGIAALLTLEDLQRYCYYVAGTVGHMLTGLFLAEMKDVTAPQRSMMRQNAESFGLALQLVNILKDVTDDRERGVSFVPRTLCEAQGIAVAELLAADKRSAAHSAVAPVFDVAHCMLDRALEYSLAIPASQQGIRLFCLLPLWMAVRTLVMARGNDAMFVPGKPVKITRAEVEQIIADCAQHVGNDQELRSRYAALWSPEPATRTLASDGPRELH